jgi:hypothetical protein
MALRLADSDQLGCWRLNEASKTNSSIDWFALARLIGIAADCGYQLQPALQFRRPRCIIGVTPKAVR